MWNIVFHCERIGSDYRALKTTKKKVVIMSAYIVRKQHILYLVCAALSGRITPPNYGRFSYYHDGETHYLPPGDFERAAEVGNMLWLENIKSVSHRYPHESSADLPGPIGEDFVITARDICDAYFTVSQHVKPAAVFKAIDGFTYQSCEHDEWRDSEAHTFCETLRRAACRAVPGYEDAQWEVTDLNPA